MVNQNTSTERLGTKDHLVGWYTDTSVGKRLHHQIIGELDNQLERLFGYHTLFLGVPPSVSVEDLAHSQTKLIATPDDSACGESKGGCHALWCMRCRRHSRDCYACGNQVIRDEESCQCEYIAITHSRSTGRHAHSGLIPLRNLLILSHRLPWEDEGSGGSHD